MFYICNVKMLTSKNRERRNDQGRKEFIVTLSSSYGGTMDAINQFLGKGFTGVETMTSDTVVRG